MNIGDATSTELDYLEKKKELQEKNLQYQNELHSEFETLKSNAAHYGKYALIVGGAFVATYVIVGWLFSSDEDEQQQHKSHDKIIYLPATAEHANVATTQHESSMPPIAKAIMTSITTFLISIAKEKLLDYLAQLKKDDGKETLQPTS